MCKLIISLIWSAVTLCILGASAHAGGQSYALTFHSVGSMSRLSAISLEAPVPSASAVRPRAVAAHFEKTCLALALYHEARGESRHGQIAVGRTILNRARSSAYPASVCGVVWQGAHRRNACQFSFACDHRSDLPTEQASWRAMQSLAKTVIETQSHTLWLGENRHHGGLINANAVTHYHTTAVSPSWAPKLETLGTIGNHIFYRSERVTRRM
ncbi:MAG: cell wall hydrolase [Pseudomonadota bacterium]